MNTKWTRFLSECQPLAVSTGVVNQQALDHDRSLFALTHLGAIKLSGKDAASLLQGQTTYNINELSQEKSAIAAMCNPKGRVIATFLIIKLENGFLLILSADLADAVKANLQKYVLRSDVKIEIAGDEYCLLGMTGDLNSGPRFFTSQFDAALTIRMPGLPGRVMLVTGVDDAIRLWALYTGANGFRSARTEEWLSYDMRSGIPWITSQTSEEFIPQMLGLDKLGGISFNKGCYTGQEIVARTHYLGKAKRELVLAECKAAVLPVPNASILARHQDSQDVAGTVLQAIFDPKRPDDCLLLAVLNKEVGADDNLCLSDNNFTPLHLFPLSYD